MKIPNPRSELQNASLTRPDWTLPSTRKTHLLCLDKNESIDPEYADFVAELITHIPKEVIYSYPETVNLYNKLAAYTNLAAAHLLLTAGSDGAIRAVYETFVKPGEVVIYPEPTFAMYSVYAQIYGAKVIAVDYLPSSTGPLLPVDRLLSAIKQHQPRLVCLPNPNSPTGTVFKPDELKQIIEYTGVHGAVMLIDEAYYPFYQHSVASWIKDYPHLIIVRSFSKAWGLAGIRLGYAIAGEEVAKYLHKVKPMYEVGALTVAIAEKMLDHTTAMQASVQRIIAGKNYFLSEMNKLGCKTLTCQGNFLHVAFAEHADRIHQALADVVLYRKSFSQPSLAGYSRFSATTRELFQPVVTHIQEVMVNG